MPNAKKTEDMVVYQLKIELADSRPLIWRRVLVDPNESLTKLHYIIQIAMDWNGGHMWAFTVDHEHYTDLGLMMDVDELDMKDSEDIFIMTALRKEKQKIKYEYDFGDSWEHVIILEKILPRDSDKTIPVCVKAVNAAPPDDCGGIGGYYDMLEVLKDPNDPDYEMWKDWIPEDFDPNEVDIDSINKRLQGMFQKTTRKRK